MKILMVGSGGREHALIRKLAQSDKVEQIFCAPGNGGIACDAKCIDVGVMDIDKMIKSAKDLEVDMVFVAPDDPLAAGMVDELEKAGIRAFGPRANAAVIESSKVFSKNLMKKYNIPTAGYEIFSDYNKALEYIKNQNTFPTVIKADGLALGKGVIIAKNFKEAEDALNSIMNDKVFGESGNKIVVEEFITGPEVSVLAFTDGKTMCPMVSSMDHKRALDGDEGLNTGGMGTISPNPFYTAENAKYCMDNIFIPTMNAMNSENRTFKGCLYFGLMITPNGVKVIEYNARFGDPETQVVLPRLKTDLVDIVDAIIDERLDEIIIEWDEKSSACVVLASGGYPISYEKGKVISGLKDNGQIDSAIIYHAGTKLENNKFKTSGGRVLGVTALGNTVQDALDSAYKAVDKISFEKMHYRKDIGTKKI